MGVVGREEEVGVEGTGNGFDVVLAERAERPRSSWDSAERPRRKDRLIFHGSWQGLGVHEQKQDPIGDWGLGTTRRR